MNPNSDTEICLQCGEKKCGDLIFHKLYCYDLYIPSAPAPRNKEQIDVDNFINEKIVEVLEKDDYCCYHGCRNFVGGDTIIQAIQKPMKIIPVTLIPVYKDQYSLTLLDMLITADKLRRIILLLFDATQIKSNLWQCCFSVEAKDPKLLDKIKKTIDRHREQTSLRRKQIVSREMDTAPFRTPDGSRKSFRPCCRHPCTSSSSNSFLTQRMLPHRETEDIVKEMTNISFQEIDNYFVKCWDAGNAWTRQRICQALVKNIKRDFLTFCRLSNLERLEMKVRSLIQCNGFASSQELHIQLEKLYCWILAAMFVHVSTMNNAKLDALLRGMVFTKCTDSSKERNYKYLCFSAYQKIRMAISTAAKKKRPWQNSIQKHLKHLESFLNTLEKRVNFANERILQFRYIQKQLQRVPWIIRHIFILVLTEKVFEAKLLAVSQPFLFHVCTKMGKKHWEIFLEITERLTEHIQASHTQGAVRECLDLLQGLWEWCMQTASEEKKSLATIILNHSFHKLLYHSLSEVRHCVAPLLFGEDGTYTPIAELGHKAIPADPCHVEAALQECLQDAFPELTLKGQMKTNGSFMFVQGVTHAGKAKVCIAKQQSLNDILQTNTTESDCERFQEVIQIVAVCQDRESIAKLQMSSAYGVPPLYVIEDGNPLLTFLQEKRNKLTLSAMIGILKVIARAVWSCHQKKVLLCSITPASFIVVRGEQQGTGAPQLRVKLSDFLQARLTPPEDEKDYSSSDCLYETIKSVQLRGDREDPLPIYFSAPECLQHHLFSAFSDVWATAATFYSVLLYGAQTYFELRHLPVARFIGEICSGHRAQRPGSIPLKLWDIITPSLEYDEQKRTTMEVLVECMESCGSTMGPDLDKLHEVMSQFSPICEEDIIRGYLDSRGNFKKSDSASIHTEKCEDSVKRKDGCLCELVSFRMNHITKMALYALEHENILPIKEITHYSPMNTSLISMPLHGNPQSLIEVAAHLGMDDNKVLTCLEQVASAMAYLHSRRIIHCDLRCSYIYVNAGQSYPEMVAKVGRWGRAVCLPHPGTDENLFEPYVHKLMPADSAKWAAPEVRNYGFFSRASDVFSFGIVMWEALTAHMSHLHMFKPLKPFHLLNSKEVLKFTELRDFSFPKFSRLTECMKSCWNYNPTRRPAFLAILEVITKEKQAIRNSEATMLAAESDSTDSEDYDSVYFRSDASNEDSCSHIYSVVAESDPGIPHCTSDMLDPPNLPWDQPLEGDDVYFSKQDRWGEMVNEFETKRGIERSLAPIKETEWYGDTGISWNEKNKHGESRKLDP
ncbi:uncharacterized protein LOC136055056 [Cyrtonyx montezumae]|uniref:uncharacterized protein LOC136055056 n=1 Tax=Cyrtonyx montezumae TaxID=9017 RepID=UPI0032D9EF64